MNPNKTFLKKNFNSILQCSLLLCVIFSACNYQNYITTYVANDKEKIYFERKPCEVLMVMKIEDEKLNQLELIGTCVSNKRAGGLTGNVNNAMKEIRKCACYNGGDLLLIVDTQEKSKLAGEGLVYNGIPVGEGPLGDTKIVISDRIEALVYRKK